MEQVVQEAAQEIKIGRRILLDLTEDFLTNLSHNCWPLKHPIFRGETLITHDVTVDVNTQVGSGGISEID